MLRTTSVIACLLVVVSSCALTRAAQSANSADNKSDANLKELLQTRVELHRKLVRLFESLGKTVEGKEALAEARIQQHYAEFEAAEAKQDRIAALTKIVEIRKDLLDLAVKQHNRIEMMQCEIHWADAEIALAREKLKN